MELLLEARKGNKEAFKELTEDLEIKLYKTARYYFSNEEDIIYVMQKTLKELFKEIVNVKTEEHLMPLAIKFLIKYCEETHLKRSKNKSWLQYISSDRMKELYEQYRESSIEEQYITSLNKDLRLIAILYFYDGLGSHQIAYILKMSSKNVDKIVSIARDRLYEMISDEGTKKYNEYVK
jgi:RNA polymerase sigma-70 factor (ECF subfamily)